MRYSLLALGMVAAAPFAFVMCSRKPVLDSGPPRDSVLPVWLVATQSGLRVPNPACTCASPESYPAPSRYEAECDERFATCGDVHYAEYLARAGSLPAHDRAAILLTTHFVESMVYDATIQMTPGASREWADHDSEMRVRIGDIIPTPRGRARVVQVYRSFVEGDDDGRARLHFEDPFASDPPSFMYVSSGAPSHLDGRALTLVRATGGEAEVVTDAGTTLHLRRGDVVTTPHGSFPIVEVVDGHEGGALGWIVVDTRFSR